ncbi:sigma-54 interaction domain-containing protein [Ectobacillus sp. sgz5001026]|uniref:sigma-54 interaction domain-containing protein n=1 Tax=Ectobacillus sp. sgz5001026 TaxID=3242473 RepID=UPI0036D3221A
MHTQNLFPYEWLEEVLNVAAEWIVVVDIKGMIRYINTAYCDYLQTTVEDALGRDVQDVIENTRMHIVMKTGKSEEASIHSIKGKEMIANRYPLIVKGELVGAVGTVMFRNSEDWMNYSEKVQPILEELKYYKNRLQKELQSKYSFDDLIGEHALFRETKRLAQRVAGSQSVVLLVGESGTGKELFAHAIHGTSPRSSFSLVRVNCASIPENLLESELFGYVDGAFTGARKGGKKGKFELAHRGTIFLDEIGDMPLSMQSKLLRVLQEREIEKIGGQAPISIDVRIIVATHRNLEQMVENGTFRRDLYYRLHVMKIEIPPLRERRTDIERVAKALLQKLERTFNRHAIVLSDEVVAKLKGHSWPGNVRELENVLERAVNVLDENVIRLSHLPLYLVDKPSQLYETPEQETEIKPLKQRLMDAEKCAVRHALQQAKGNKQLAAKLLRIGKTSFYEKCKRYEID